MKTTVKSAYQSDMFFKEIERMIHTARLVGNKKMGTKVNNGWNVFLPYTKSLIFRLGKQTLLKVKGGVELDGLGGHSMRLEKHLLWEVDGQSDWIEVAKKSGFKHVSN